MIEYLKEALRRDLLSRYHLLALAAAVLANMHLPCEALQLTYLGIAPTALVCLS